LKTAAWELKVLFVGMKVKHLLCTQGGNCCRDTSSKNFWLKHLTVAGIDAPEQKNKYAR
jgi:hypothetical protein